MLTHGGRDDGQRKVVFEEDVRDKEKVEVAAMSWHEDDRVLAQQPPHLMGRRGSCVITPSTTLSLLHLSKVFFIVLAIHVIVHAVTVFRFTS